MSGDPQGDFKKIDKQLDNATRWTSKKENKREKGLPTRSDLGTIQDFMPGQSGEFKVSEVQSRELGKTKKREKTKKNIFAFCDQNAFLKYFFSKIIDPY